MSLQDRRSFLTYSALLAGSTLLPKGHVGAYTRPAAKKKVAGIVTIYRKFSHADVLLGKILDGWKQDGGAGPNLELVSLYVDQFPADDMARQLAAEHGFKLCSTIEEAITLGSNQVAVDGVISVGEHGDYPYNEKQQHLYPRRRFFTEITDTFEKFGKIVPVFNDKHLGPVWEDALWMYQRARELKIPFMAGSSIPVSYRQPNVGLPMHAEVEAAIAVGYSGLDIYGFHTLELLQSFMERRANAEEGVASVQTFPGSELPRLIDTKVVHEDLLRAVLQVTPKNSDKEIAEVDPAGFTIFLVQYRDGFLVPVLMLDGYARGISACVKPLGAEPIAAYAEERPEPYYPHFANLLYGIEQMIHSGKPAYPVERTLLTAGILDRALTSRHEDFRKLETPELAIEYTPVDYPWGDQIKL